MYDASNRKDIRRAEKLARAAELARVEFIRAAMSTLQGRAWFHHLLSFCNIFRTTFADEPTRTAFNEGGRNVGLMVYNDILQNIPDQFVRMMQEAHERELTSEQRDRHDHDGDTGDEDDLDSDDDGSAFDQLSGGP